MTSEISRGVLVSTFLRSFLIQGSWNYHTMLGAGFAFAMLPGLRRLFGNDGSAMRASLDRHLEHFNAHPYMSTLALGAALRLEAEGSDADTVRRFKSAVRGPLGGLGDTLVWATWLPSMSVAGLALLWLGVPGWLAAVAFLVAYNLGHLWLRVWAFRAGLREGRDVGRRLGRTDLMGWATRLRGITALLVGLLAGAVLAGRGGLSDAGPLWGALATAAFVGGLLAGHHAWRPAAVAVVGVVALLAAWGLAA